MKTNTTRRQRAQVGKSRPITHIKYYYTTTTTTSGASFYSSIFILIRLSGPNTTTTH